MRKLLLAGGVMQAASALTLLAQNALVPSLMGADAYGRAIALVVLPLLLQGLLEPMAVGVAIATEGRTNRIQILRRSFQHLLIGVPLIGAASVLYAMAQHASAIQLVLLTLFVGLVSACTALRAIAYAATRLGILAAHYLTPLGATFASLPLLSFANASGYVAMLCNVQLATVLVLLLDAEVRKVAAAVLKSKHGANATFHFASTYLENIAPRLAQIALGPGMLMLASFQLGALQLAEFRVLQALSGALSYALPVNTSLAQAVARKGASEPPHEGNGLPLIAVAGAIALVGGALLWIIYPFVVSYILRLEVGSEHFRTLVLAAPFYVLTPVLASVLLGWQRGNVVLRVNALMLPIVGAFSFAAGIDVGFAVGCTLFAFGLGLAVLKGNVGNGRAQAWRNDSRRNSTGLCSTELQNPPRMERKEDTPSGRVPGI